MPAKIFDRKEIYVGRDYGGMTYDMSPALAAKFTEATGDDNPWYRGDSPLGGALAPALILHSAVYRTTEWYLPHIYGNLHARQQFDLFQPVMIGERLSSRVVVIERYDKRDREYVVAETLITNAAGALVSRGRTHQSFLRAEQSKKEAFVIDRAREKDQARSFKVGERGGEAIETPMRQITEQMCMAFSGPVRNYHNDRQKAIELGFPEIVVQGMFSVCLVSELMTRRFGLGFVQGGKMDLRLVNIVWGNDVTGARGRIVERRPEGKRTRAEVEVWCEKSDGTKTIVGSASAIEL